MSICLAHQPAASISLAQRCTSLLALRQSGISLHLHYCAYCRMRLLRHQKALSMISLTHLDITLCQPRALSPALYSRHVCRRARGALPHSVCHTPGNTLPRFQPAFHAGNRHGAGAGEAAVQPPFTAAGIDLAAEPAPVPGVQSVSERFVAMQQSLHQRITSGGPPVCVWHTPCLLEVIAKDHRLASNGAVPSIHDCRRP